MYANLDKPHKILQQANYVKKYKVIAGISDYLDLNSDICLGDIRIHI
jgi:hypothetical protein